MQIGENMKIAIIGGGASGLMAAITAARSGAEVTILEHENKPGKKLLMTGNGRCNLTNKSMWTEYFHGDPHLVQTILSQFSWKGTVSFFEDQGMILKDKDGYMYPNSMQAQSVLKLLLCACEELHVKIKTNCQVKQIIPMEQGSRGYHISFDTIMQDFDAVILACGSRSYPETGSDGSGYVLAQNLNIPMTAVHPALCGIRSKENWCRQSAGVRCDGTIFIYANDTLLAKDTGEIQFTDYGVSGIPVFQVSRYVSLALAEGKSVTGKIDFFPGKYTEELAYIFEQKKRKHPRRRLKEQFLGILPEKLIPVFLDRLSLTEQTITCEAGDMKWQKISQLLKNFTFSIYATNDFLKAQVCCGGIDTASVCIDSLESKQYENLYFAGEILDVDGKCGGYNLQWAWSTGYVAGKNAAIDKHGLKRR